MDRAEVMPFNSVCAGATDHRAFFGLAIIVDDRQAINNNVLAQQVMFQKMRWAFYVFAAFGTLPINL
jgi:hypothetical protein